jgi:hypothetical protein
MENLNLLSEVFFIRLLIDAISMIVLVRFVYFRTYKNKDSFFTFFLLNLIVFILLYMLEKTGGFDHIGSAFGLLAAFTLLRFRTETISMKDMTYLFIIMTFGLINSIMKGTYLEIISLNVLIIAVVYLVDGSKLIRNYQYQMIEFPSIENIRPDRQTQLITDLKEYTGLDIKKIAIEHVDIGKARAIIKIYYV